MIDGSLFLIQDRNENYKLLSTKYYTTIVFMVIVQIRLFIYQLRGHIDNYFKCLH